jgi:biotin carboxylase
LNKKAILIFGSGDNQLTLIKSAKEKYSTVVIDPYEDTPGRKFADEYCVVHPQDFDGTCRVVEEFNIKGIVTAQMENPLLMMSRIAEKYSFLFPSIKQIRRARNKFLMKEAFLKCGVPCAKGKLYLKDEKITEESLSGFNYPLIIKPADAFSSRGVVSINYFGEIADYEAAARTFSSDGSVVVEEFLEGKEFSVESLTYHGKTEIIQITEKIITDYPYTVEMGHIQPAELSDQQKAQVEAIVKKAISSLELDNCASHTELKLTHEGPKIIEIGARLGGDYISSYLTLHSTGVNMDAAAADIAMGNTPDIEIKCNGYSGIFYFHLDAGSRIKEINNWMEILKHPNVVHAGILIKAGDIIPPLTDSAKRTGFIIIKSNSRKSLFILRDELLPEIKRYIIPEL